MGCTTEVSVIAIPVGRERNVKRRRASARIPLAAEMEDALEERVPVFRVSRAFNVKKRSAMLNVCMVGVTDSIVYATQAGLVSFVTVWNVTNDVQSTVSVTTGRAPVSLAGMESTVH